MKTGRPIHRGPAKKPVPVQKKPEPLPPKVEHTQLSDEQDAGKAAVTAQEKLDEQKTDKP